MLQKIHIINYAIIEELEMSFSNGFNVITGDTGAGKSIILDAIGLVFGKKIDSNSILDDSRKTIVEVSFDISKRKEIRAFLQEQGLLHAENSNLLVLRREMNPRTKVSKAIINETPTVLQDMQAVGSLVIDIHQQFDTQSLITPLFQLKVLDAMAMHSELLTDYREAYNIYMDKLNEIGEMELNMRKTLQEKDYLSFVCRELEEINFKPGEIENLEKEIKIIENAVILHELISNTVNFLKEGEPGVVRELAHLSKKFAYYGKDKQDFNEIARRLESCGIELDDIASEVADMERNIFVDEHKIEQMRQRLDEGFRLLAKYQVKSTDELLEFYAKTIDTLKNLEKWEQDMYEHKKQLHAMFKKALFFAESLSFNRAKAAKSLEIKILPGLVALGMTNARIIIKVKKMEGKYMLNDWGMDEVSFLIDTNKTSIFEPIGKIASGGEMSRIMLTIKSLVAQNLDLCTLIFDEIDTGVSGEVAKQIGHILAGLSRHLQLICITHQPTIVARARVHWHLEKGDQDGKIRTRVRKLSFKDRVHQLAIMLEGEPVPSSKFLEAAYNMLEEDENKK